MKAICKNWEEDEFQVVVVGGREVWDRRRSEKIGCEKSKLFAHPTGNLFKTHLARARNCLQLRERLRRLRLQEALVSESSCPLRTNSTNESMQKEAVASGAEVVARLLSLHHQDHV